MSDRDPAGPPSHRLWVGLLSIILIVMVMLLLGAYSLSNSGTSGQAASAAAARPTLPTTTPGPAPALVLPGLDGETVALDQWRGQAIVLNFWATWCYPCRVEMPALATIHEAHDDVVVVGVNYLESPDKARAFVEEFALPFPIVLDSDGAMADELGVIGLPSTFFIDANGQITGSHLGPISEERLQEIVAELRAR